MISGTQNIDNTIKAKTYLSALKRDSIRRNWFKFSKNKFSVLGLIIVLITILLAILAPVITPFPLHVEAFVDFANANTPPNSKYIFGTDIFGRDVFTRVIFSFRGALMMSIVVLGTAVPLGVVLGLIGGYYHNKLLGILIMRTTDIFLSLPKLVLAMAIAAVLEPNLMNSMIALVIVWWTWYARMVYSLTVILSNENFVKSAELLGASKTHILFKEILPNCLSPIATKMALDVGWVILIGATLSFVGLGEQPPTPSFGQLIADGSRYMPDLWWTTIFPALGIAFMIIGFNFLGDGVRDMFDKGRQ